MTTANLVSVLPALTRAVAPPDSADGRRAERRRRRRPCRAGSLDRSADDTDVGWGERDQGSNDDRLTRTSRRTGDPAGHADQRASEPARRRRDLRCRAVGTRPAVRTGGIDGGTVPRSPGEPASGEAGPASLATAGDGRGGQQVADLLEQQDVLGGGRGLLLLARLRRPRGRSAAATTKK